MTAERERRGVFGEAVEQYDSARPGYPAQLVDNVLAYAGPGPVLEVGAGTGKATVAFVGRGVELTCVEADPRMAAVLRRRCPGATVVVSQFESWAPTRRFGLLFSAQAWHWVDADRRNDLAHAALATGGALALFWNVFALADPVLRAALAEVDSRHGLPAESMPHARPAGPLAAELPTEFQAEWSTLRLSGDPRFGELTSRRYRWSLRYPTANYLDLLASISMLRMLDPGPRDAALSDVATVLDAHGGVIELAVATDLALARRAD
jgi:SAM-dependent methyltransferase